MVLEKTLESPLDCKEIKPVKAKLRVTLSVCSEIPAPFQKGSNWRREEERTREGMYRIPFQAPTQLCFSTTDSSTSGDAIPVERGGKQGDVLAR